MVIDFYGRTAGISPRDDSFDGMKHLPLLEAGHVDADVAAAAALLREENPGPVFTVGFCLGGGHSWRQASRNLGLAGAIGFYGPPRFFGDATADLSAPLLMLLAGDDVATPQEEFQALVAGFKEAGKEYEVHVYDGAPHSFFDVIFGNWEQQPARIDKQNSQNLRDSLEDQFAIMVEPPERTHHQIGLTWGPQVPRGPRQPRAADPQLLTIAPLGDLIGPYPQLDAFTLGQLAEREGVEAGPTVKAGPHGRRAVRRTRLGGNRCHEEDRPPPAAARSGS